MVPCPAAAADEGLDNKTPSLGLGVVVVDSHMHNEMERLVAGKIKELRAYSITVTEDCEEGF